MSAHRSLRARLLLAALLTGVVLLVGGARGGSPGEVKLQAVKRKQLQQELKKFHGKIVVLDVWADFCLPCKKEFPHLVALHKKYGGRGVVCVSVSVDEPEQHAAALKFLKAKGATFPNYRLDEEPPGWQEHFDIYGPPAVFVYGRDGKLVGRFDGNDVNKTYSHEDVEKLLRKVLSQTGTSSPK